MYTKQDIIDVIEEHPNQKAVNRFLKSMDRYSMEIEEILNTTQGKDFDYFKMEVERMFRLNEKIIEIQKDVKIGEIILEKGDKIEILKESMQIGISGNMALLILNAIGMYRKSSTGRDNFSDAEFDFVYERIEQAL